MEPGPSRAFKNAMQMETEIERGEFELDVKQLDDFSDDSSVDEHDPLLIVSDHDSETEQLNSDDEGDSIVNEDTKCFYGRDGFEWNIFEPIKPIRPVYESVTAVPDIYSRDGHDIPSLFFWDFLISPTIIEEIVHWINNNLKKIGKDYARSSKPALNKIDETELKAFLGLLLYTAVFKCNDEHVEEIFATDGTSRDIFRCIMSKERFLIILRCLRYDDQTIKKEGRQRDVTVPIINIFRGFIENCQKLYPLGVDVCVDELIVGFNGVCKFKMHFPNGNVKNGIKMICLTDACTNYLYNAYIYTEDDRGSTGLSEIEKTFSKPTQSVLRLTKPIFGTNRNITADSWFGSIELASVLQSKMLSYVGPLKKNTMQIPPEFLPRKNRKVNSALYGFSDTLTLISYVPKKSRAVLLISSMNHHMHYSNEKPEALSHYNATKGSVANLAIECEKFSTKRPTRKWTLAVFFQMLDFCAYNSYIAFVTSQDTNTTRTDWTKDLAKQLIRPHLRRRYENTNIPKDIRNCIQRVLGERQQHVDVCSSEILVKRKTCYLCPSQIRRKTAYLCFSCRQPVCLQCAKKLCVVCAQNDY